MSVKCVFLHDVSQNRFSLQVIAIPDDDEKSQPAEQESKKNGEEPMETDKPSNGEAESVKEKEGEKEKEEGESEKKSPEGGEEAKPAAETKTEASEVKPEDSEVKGKKNCELLSCVRICSLIHSLTIPCKCVLYSKLHRE